MIRWLAIVACAFTVAVTAASALIRHAQAGVGCTPWPACYRAATAATAAEATAAGTTTAGTTTAGATTAGATTAGTTTAGTTTAGTTTADRPGGEARAGVVVAARALHRVSAMTVGLLALALALFGWSGFDRGERAAAAFALVDVMGLAWLGRFTPHDLPLVTIGNVVGGFALAAAFGWLAARPRDGAPGPGRPREANAVGRLPAGALAALALMATLGVMIAARHAIDACDALACLPDARFDPRAFDPARAAPAVGEAAGSALKFAHRVAAVPFIALALLLAVRLQRRGGDGAALAVPLAGLVALQVVAGLVAAAGATLATHVVHNAGAALLAVVLAALARRGAASSIDGPRSRADASRGLPAHVDPG